LLPSSFAQKLHRFCSNPRVQESDLIEPLHQAIRHEAIGQDVLLAVHDWSTLSFGGHASKADRATLTHPHDLGYDLATVLMVRASDGASLAPADVRLKTATGVLTTHGEEEAADVSHIDQVRPAMRRVRDRNFGATVVHVIDREADSVDHWRQWSADGHWALVRADNRQVLHAGQETTLETLADDLRRRNALRAAGPVSYRGRKARLWTGEVAVVLHKPGMRHVGTKKKGGKRRAIAVPGPPLPLRLIVAEVRDLTGRVLARWLLLTNAPAELGDATAIAHWYYYRWRIESLHKLLKSAGWQLEDWLQRNGERLFKKLLLAFGACVAVWELERRTDEQSRSFQRLLMQLSGRQTKRSRPVTTSGLLAGLWVLQAALGPLGRHGPDQLNGMLQQHLPLFAAT
jgi:hypothetical protein